MFSWYILVLLFEFIQYSGIQIYKWALFQEFIIKSVILILEFISPQLRLWMIKLQGS